MNVSLTPKLEDYVRQKVASGLYNSASEVMREALRNLQEKEKEQLLFAELDKGVQDIEAGRSHKYTPELIDDIFDKAMAEIDKSE